MNRTSTATRGSARTPLLAALALGLVALFAGWSLRGLAEEAQAGEEADLARAAAPGSGGAGAESSAGLPPLDAVASEQSESEDAGADARRAIDEADPEERPSGEEGLISAALRAHALRGIRAGWTKERGEAIPDRRLAEGMARFEEMVRERPADIGRWMADEETEIEAARALGPGILLLHQLEEGLPADPNIVKDRGTFEGLFTPSSALSRKKGPEALRADKEPPADGTTLEFPAGVFRIEESRLFRIADETLRDVTLAGSGKASTLLVLGDISTRVPLANLTLRDCTIHLGKDSGSLLDVRSDPVSLRLESVRVVGIGSGSIIDADQLAFHAIDSEFLNGYSRSPRASARLFDVRSDGLVARFDGGRLQEMSLGAVHFHDLARVHFEGTVFEDMTVDAEAEGNAEWTVSFSRCHFSQLPADESGRIQPARRDLNELFPDWEARMVTLR